MKNYPNTDVITHTELYDLVMKHRPGAHDQRSHAGKTQGVAGAVGGAVRGVAAAAGQIAGAAKTGGAKGAVAAGKGIATAKFSAASVKGKKVIENGKKSAKAFLKSDDVKTAVWLGKGYLNATLLPYKLAAGAVKLTAKTAGLAVKLTVGLAKLAVSLHPAVLGAKVIRGIAITAYKLSHRNGKKKSLVIKAEEQENLSDQDAKGIISYLDSSKQDFMPVLNIAMANDAAIQAAPDNIVSPEDKGKSATMLADMKKKFLEAGFVTKEELAGAESGS